MTAAFKQTKMTILLSINAVAILVAGVLVAGAVFFKGGMNFRVVDERSDDNGGEVAAPELIDADTGAGANLTAEQLAYQTSVHTPNGVSSAPVPAGELWAEKSIKIYESADYDICVGGELSDLGEMYWQTSDTSVISGFFSGARTWLGYSDDTCRFPIIVGTGTTTITAGTYDGTRRDSIEVIVEEIPKIKWEYEILSLVNQERVRNGLSKLTWGETCTNAAEIRAEELVQLYSHTRPDGSSWSTACDNPNGNSGSVEGENLAAGSLAVSPETTVAAWMNSEKHRENILNPDYTKLAVGFYFDPNSQYKTHWSQYFSNF